MNNIILFIFVKGDGFQKPKQEIKLFSYYDNKQLWNKVFKELGFSEYRFTLLTKELKKQKIEEKKDKIGHLIYEINEIHPKCNIKIIFTGDYDVEREKKTISKISNQLKDHFSKYVFKIVLIDGFKLEHFMTEISNPLKEEWNKKNLKREIGTIHPSTRQLFNNENKLPKPINDDFQIKKNIYDNI